LASAAGFAAVGLATGDPRRAAAGLVVCTPKAAALGRDGFASHLARELAGRAALVLGREALRRLDRIDTIVLDAPALSPAGPEIEQVVALGGFDATEATGLVRALFRPGAPGRVRRRRGARLERLANGDTGLDLRRARRELGGRGELLLLSLDGKPAAVAAVGRSVPEETAVLISAARRAGHMVCVAGDEDLSRRSGADLYVEGGDRLTASIHMLQRDGCVPLLVSRRSRALAAADVGIGIVADGKSVPWGADVLVAGWSDVAFMIEASGVAHEVSRQSAAIALSGSGIGALSLLGGRAAGAGARALAAVNAAALAGLVNGTRAAAGLSRRPRPVLRRAVPWHELPVGDALARAGSRREGLTTAEVAERAPAEVATPGGPSFFRALMDELANPLTPVLAGASVLAASVGSFGDAALVGGVTGINAAVGAVERLRVERAVGGRAGHSAAGAHPA
jgi:cation-transporting P-type ATPase I